ncbi:Auxin Efflux Carrier family protein [Trichomonas vaginalis G3]|uniref:Auxin Efflux Carrier family protein n=1 Tax=Trichomonas vaginalis (strain ATCC PRA-98 / G3) TaxID=412133 RepID=A2DPS5_TRIV3|nr:intracellular auxin transport [Trichomonas vaginalis G3]EAY17521.1 Auxin Efflux Carrier family protein [Trichomonas vaginalis G3]KAI5520565.1 intracellular auxin transport [Trichomonas vaginalis G3]|eukprot:XP_001329656.1 Auxin Efflux Carrier family protein [Trichomonas vaginalis G3]
MVNYANVVSIGLAMISIMLIGYMCGKFKIMTKEGAAVLNRYVYRVCFLPVLARMLASKKFKEINFYPLAVATLVAVCVILMLTIIFVLPVKDKLNTYITCLMPVCYINYVISGIPIFQTIWDPNESSVVSIMTLANDLLTNPTYITLSAIWSIGFENQERLQNGEIPKKFGWPEVKNVLIRIVTSPILLGNAAGLIYSATGLPMPTFVAEFLKLGGDVVLPMSLFCFGVFLSHHTLVACGWIKFISCLAIRHLISPAWAVLWCYVLKLPGKLSRQCVIMTAQPTAAVAYLLAESTGLGQGIASTMVFWTTIICIPAILFWLWLFDITGLFKE